MGTLAACLNQRCVLDSDIGESHRGVLRTGRSLAPALWVPPSPKQRTCSYWKAIKLMCGGTEPEGGAPLRLRPTPDRRSLALRVRHCTPLRLRPTVPRTQCQARPQTQLPTLTLFSSVVEDQARAPAGPLRQTASSPANLDPPYHPLRAPPQRRHPAPAL